MKNTIYIIIIFVFFAGFYSCKKSIEDPLDGYSEYGIFKDIYPLQDSVTVDLKPGDSTFIETNKGKIWITVNYISVACYKSIDPTIGCTDLGNAVVYSIRSNNDILEIKYIQEGFPIDSPKSKLALGFCFYVSKVNDRYIPRFTLGKSNILFRGIYPYPQNKKEYEDYNTDNGKKLHLILTFQKICT